MSKNVNYESLLNSCINGIRNKQNIKQEFKLIKPNLLEDKKKYMDLAKNKKINILQKNVTHSQALTKEDYKWLYEQRLVNSTVGRPFYDSLINSEEYCLYCRINDPQTLDHYLSKMIYPNYSVLPDNLIPCCSKCNQKKGETNTDDTAPIEDFYIHPYFETFDKLVWLKAKLDTSDNNQLLFVTYIDQTNLDQSTFLRIKKQFDELKLFTIYNTKLTRKLNNSLKYYKATINTTTDSTLLSEFQRKLDNSILPTNNWENIYYRTLIENYELILICIKSNL